MWPKAYRDYPVDSPMIKYPVEPNKGIVGCEMHELNGWGNSYHVPRNLRKKGVLATILDSTSRYFTRN